MQPPVQRVVIGRCGGIVRGVCQEAPSPTGRALVFENRQARFSIIYKNLNSSRRAEVPTITLSGLSDTQKRALRIGRNRTNVWDYASVNSMRGSRREDLALHLTVKPTPAPAM